MTKKLIKKPSSVYIAKTSLKVNINTTSYHANVGSHLVTVEQHISV